MKWLLMVILGGVSISPCLGQSQETFQVCSEKSSAQSDLNKCASDEAARADAALNLIYKNVLAKLNKDDVAISKLRVSERAWIQYRDSYIAAVFPASDKQLAYGTEYPMDVDLLRAKLTVEHQNALQYLMNEYQPVQ